MNIKMLKAAVAGLVLSVSSFANAGLIVGDDYLDTDNVSWEYIGSFQVNDGPAWSSTVEMFNGLDAAEEVFGNLAENMLYALSTLDSGLVNHLANYDGYGQSNHVFAEDIIVDINGNGLYNSEGAGQGDWSAYITDHSNTNVNYVFQRTVNAQIPEPTTLAIFGLGLLGLASRRSLLASKK
jgi:hypothetical protein